MVLNGSYSEVVLILRWLQSKTQLYMLNVCMYIYLDQTHRIQYTISYALGYV